MAGAAPVAGLWCGGAGHGELGWMRSVGTLFLARTAPAGTLIEDAAAELAFVMRELGLKTPVVSRP